LNSTLIDVARTQVWHVPFLLMYIVGLFLSRYLPGLGRARPFAVSGFAILIVSLLLQAAQMYQALSGGDYLVIAARAGIFTFGITIVKVAGFALVMTALFIDRRKTTDARPPTAVA
jgi:hypothetical protein